MLLLLSGWTPTAAPAAGDGLRWVGPQAVSLAPGEPDPVVLGDGRRIRLAGIEVPGLGPAAPDALAAGTRAALAELLDGAEVSLGLGPADLDRYGRVVAHLRRADDGRWVQGELLRRGLARVRTAPDQRALASAMLDLERRARAQGRGIWADPAYAVLPDDAAAAFVGSFQVVTGRIERVADSRGYLYLNFDQDWRRDFTVRVRRGDLRAFRREGLDPDGLGGRRVRVRGWLLEAGGPLVELSHPEQIEVLE